jgi:thiamine biosynthesis lipoprotein
VGLSFETASPLAAATDESLRRMSRRELLALDFPSRPAPDEHWIRVHRPAMACRFEVTLSGDDAAKVPAAREALDEIDRIESSLTVFRETSDLVRVNRVAFREPVAVDEALFGLLRLCGELHARTAGAFDVTTTTLSRCWGFLRREGRLPSAEEIAAARAVVGMDGVELDEIRRTVRFRRPGLELNLGAIGKGYALDRVGALLRRRGVSRALLSAGGSSVLALGGDPSGWIVDLRSPQAKRERLARLRLRDAALGTSGAGEQFVEVGGKRYGHVLDPRTGWPASGVLSASVVAPEAAVADALSTAFLIGGADLARRYCAAHSGVLALVTPDDGSERPRVFGECPGAGLEGA